MQKVIMTTDEIIRDEKVQYYINREAVNIYTLLSGTIDEYKYFAGKEIWPPQQSRIIEQARFTYPPLGKTFNKKNKYK